MPVYCSEFMEVLSCAVRINEVYCKSNAIAFHFNDTFFPSLQSSVTILSVNASILGITW